MKFRRTRFAIFSGFLLDLGKLFVQRDTLERMVQRICFVDNIRMLEISQVRLFYLFRIICSLYEPF